MIVSEGIAIYEMLAKIVQAKNILQVLLIDGNILQKNLAAKMFRV